MDPNLWPALAGIGTIALAIVTYLSLEELKYQASLMRSRARTSRLNEEMTKLVAPLKVRKDDKDGSFYFDLNRSDFAPESMSREQGTVSYYYVFWDNIRINMYLGPEYLWTAIYNYSNTKEKYYVSRNEHNYGSNRYSGVKFDDTEESKKIVEIFNAENALLKSQIERRYFEIKGELETGEEEIKKKGWWQFWK